MEISIYAPYAKERFETARQHSILYLERIVGKPEVVQAGSGDQYREVLGFSPAIDRSLLPRLDVAARRRTLRVR